MTVPGARKLPDLRVSIDFGTTGTAVCWDIPREEPHLIRSLFNWPGSKAEERKVPTILAKEPDGNSLKWGFLCNNMPEKDKWRRFKLFMDPEELQKAKGHIGVPETMEIAHDLVRDYLRGIYNHISGEIPRTIRRTAARRYIPGVTTWNTWDDWAVEFIFSVPTTWKPDICQNFKKLAREAGFDKKPFHNVILGLTEAEAAAVYTLEYRPKDIHLEEGNIVLSIDAGGGTTDLAFVKLLDKNQVAVWEEVQPVTGIGCGSMAIDARFRHWAKGQLSKSNPNLKRVLWNMSQTSKFQTLKHKFGNKVWDNQGGEWTIELEGEKVTFNKEHMANFFDGALISPSGDNLDDGIQACIDRALDKLPRGNISIKYVFLSGGLGSSEHVFKKLTEYFQRQSHKPCVQNIMLLPSSDPMVAIAGGLLLDQRIKTYMARGNYGVMVEEDQETHWLVETGDKITPNNPRYHVAEKYPGSKNQAQWSVTIVWSKDREDGRPHQQYIKILLRSKMVVDKKKWVPFVESEWFCEYKLGLVVGPCGDWIVVTEGVSQIEATKVPG